jgi:hypothetical protein
MEAVGFIGLGRMGRPMASNLCRKGFRLVVYDINPHAVSELELLQASGASTAAEVARRSQIVVTMLPGPDGGQQGDRCGRWSDRQRKPWGRDHGYEHRRSDHNRKACEKGASARLRL